MGRQVWQVLGLAVALGSTGWAQVTQRVSVSSSGAQGDHDSGGSSAWGFSISTDGRYVAFASLATNLVPGDTNNSEDIFVHDRQTGMTERVSIDSGGTQGNDESESPSISADGRFVAFVSHATNLVPGDTNGAPDIFVHDRLTGTTERVSIDSAGAEADGLSDYPSISADGRFVAFMSNATNLVPGDTNNSTDIFVHDRQTGRTEQVSLATGSVEGNGQSYFPSISANGRYVAFSSQATNLVSGDTNGAFDVFVRDRQYGTTERVSVDSNGAQDNGDTLFPNACSISADGRFVAFDSASYNLVPGDTNGHSDIFVHDRRFGTTERVSLATGGTQGNFESTSPSISADGRCVVFTSLATNLVSGDTNGCADVFIHDRQSGTTDSASVATGGAEGNQYSLSYAQSISADGRYVVFDSLATNLVSGDTNGHLDVFVRDRYATGFTSLCDPGVGGVIACPCANPPSALGRGCDNSSATGGAILSASGTAYLSADSLVFTTSGERPTATSILLQGSALAPAGIVYGQGVRCVGGTLKRLFTKTAVAGSITAPDFGAGDPTVSARSAAKGDVIQPGESRWYLVYYRDPTVLGGCPASSTFNATQTGRVDWSL